jgi:hypothetical protein
LLFLLAKLSGTAKLEVFAIHVLILIVAMHPPDALISLERRPSGPIPIPKKRLVVLELPEAFVPPHLFARGRFGELKKTGHVLC